MENYKTYYNKNVSINIGTRKTKNAWEYYFEQPYGYTLDDIKHARLV